MTLKTNLYYKSRRLPVVGDWISRAGYMYDLMAYPCSPTPEVWVTAFFHNAPRLLWSLFKPQPFDLVSERWGTHHHARRKRRFKPLEAIAPKDVIPGDKWGKVATAIFPAKEMAERIGWYLLVVDATTEFIVNWTTTAYQVSGCMTPGAPFCRSEADDTVFIGDTGGSWALFNHWNVKAFDGYPGTATAIQTSDGTACSICASITTKPFSPLFKTSHVTAVRVIDQVRGVVVAEATANRINDDISQASVQWHDWTDTYQGAFYEVWYQASEGLALPGGSVFQAMGQKGRGLFRDP